MQSYRRDYLNGAKPSGAARLKPKTREVYETGLKRIEAWAGKLPLTFITPARIGVLRDKCARPISDGGLGHSATFARLRVLRQLFAYAESVDLMPRGSNPATNFNLGKPPARRMVWELEDDAAFDAAAYELGLPGMALARQLGLYSAQREGDLIAFTEPQLQELDILEPVLRDRLCDENGRVMGWCLSQGKTSTEYVDVRLEIPLEPVLLEKVEAALRTNRALERAASPPRLITHLLVDDRTGLPWKQRAFITCWKRVLTHAADRTGRERMRDLVWHDLRSIEEMLRVYGPVDPTITANAIVASLEPRPKREDQADRSNKPA